MKQYMEYEVMHNLLFLHALKTKKTEKLRKGEIKETPEYGE